MGEGGGSKSRDLMSLQDEIIGVGKSERVVAWESRRGRPESEHVR